MKLTARTISFAICLGLLTAGTIMTGCASTESGAEYGRSASTYQNDKSIQQNVLQGLSKNPEYKFGAVSVNVFNGDVQLSGFVKTDTEKTEAAATANQVPGVKSVINNIQVASQSQSN